MYHTNFKNAIDVGTKIKYYNIVCLTAYKKKSKNIQAIRNQQTGDYVKIRTKIVIVAVVIAVCAAAVIFAFRSLGGKYTFKGEPQLKKTELTLEKRSLASRTQLTSLLCRDHLTNEGQFEAYDAISDHVLSADTGRFELNKADKNDLQIALNAFRADHPEVFWLDTESCYRYYEYEDGPLVVEMNYTLTGDELKNDIELLSAAVEEISSKAPDNASDYDVELYLNEYLISNCAYQPEGIEKHNAYGALVLGQAVCDGYSHAFQLLCRRLGIECTVIEGTSDFNENAEDGHMWNCILLDGDWYHVDVTWDDTVNAVCEAERYFYLNLNTEMISTDHVISGDFADRSFNKGNYFNVFVPECVSDKLNYMRLNFVTVIDPEKDDQIVASIIESARRKENCCAFLLDANQDFNALAKEIADVYAGVWVQAANRFTNGDPLIASNGRVITYEKKRVLAIQLIYLSSE